MLLTCFDGSRPAAFMAMSIDIIHFRAEDCPMLRGTLIGESLRPGSHLDTTNLWVTRIARWDLTDSVGPDQPGQWTVIDFEADDAGADALAESLAGALRPDGGWYCDFAVGSDRVVVFAGRAFRFPRGDRAGRAEAVAFGLTVGVPEHQLDWKD
jgi:hypothetical protein